MDARTYLDKHGEAGADLLIEALNQQPGKPSTKGYFKQIAYGSRRPSPELAERFVEASKTVAASQGHQDELDFMSLLKARQIHAERVANGGPLDDQVGGSHASP